MSHTTITTTTRQATNDLKNSSILSYAYLTSKSTRNRYQRHHNHNENLPAAPLANIKSSSSSIKETTQPSSLKWNIHIPLIVFKLALLLLTLSVMVYRWIRINLFQFIYFIRINLLNQTSRKLNQSISMPNHVLVILNENLKDHKQIYCLFDSIITFFNQNDPCEITFYQFDTCATSVTEAKDNLMKKYNPNECKIKLNFYSYLQAGKGLLTKTCKTIASKVNEHELDMENVNKELIDQYFLELININEPQLVINIGSNDSLAGFSPWHLRLSEIIFLPSYKLVNSLTLTDILIKYTKIEKRFGK